MRPAGTAVLAADVLAGCGQDEQSSDPILARPWAVGDARPIHVHGLGINPKDGALFVATHTGLFRAPRGQTKAKRVANRFKDSMGFTVVGPDHFLGSGHPDLREKLPPFLGLVESRDAGGAWRPVSRLGVSDFHVLEAVGRHVYGFGSNLRTREPEFLVSSDRERSWQAEQPPAELVSLAIDPADPRRVLAGSANRLFLSVDAGTRWKPLDGAAGLVAWPEAQALVAVTSGGDVRRSADGGRSWRTTGRVGGEPAAFEAETADDLIVARHDGTILHTTDGGRSWSVRSRP